MDSPLIVELCVEEFKFQAFAGAHTETTTAGGAPLSLDRLNLQAAALPLQSGGALGVLVA